MNWELKNYRNPPGYRGRNIFWVVVWSLVDVTLFRCSPKVMYGFRNVLLRIFGANIGKSCKIRPRVRILFPWKLTLGDYSWIGDDVEIYNMDDVTIGTNTVISQKSYICTGSHSVSDGTFGLKTRPIEIGDNVWLCTDVLVLPGTVIHSKTIVPARTIIERSST